MKTKYLFPGRFRMLGLLLAVPGLILGYFTLYQDYKLPGFELRLRSKDTLESAAMENFTNELALALVVVGLLLIAFSKLKREDELTSRIRLNALYWAVLVNYGIYAIITLAVLVSFIFHIPMGHSVFGPYVYYISFSIYNLFTPLVIFIVIFFFLLYRNKNEFAVKPVKYLPNVPYCFLGKWLSLLFLILMLCGYLFNAESLKSVFYIWPLSLILWVYSKEKAEDEYINSIRLQAMQVAIYMNYSILLLTNLLVYGFDFWFMQFINFFTIPIIFIAWFQYRLYAANTRAQNTLA